MLPIPYWSESKVGTLEKPPPYPAFTTIINASTRMVNPMFPAPFLIPFVTITSAVNTIEPMKIILYMVFLSFILSAAAESPRRPTALKTAETVEITPTKAANPRHFTIIFSCEIRARPHVMLI